MWSLTLEDFIRLSCITNADNDKRIKNDLNRFNMYELPNRTNRYGRRRNN